MDDDDNIGWCPCGSAWFTLAPYEESEGEYTAFCINQDGIITGYAGQMVCLECEQPWSPVIRPFLRLVEP